MAGLAAAAIVMVICALCYFLTFFLDSFLERAAHSKLAMIVVFFTVNTLTNAASAFTACVF